MLRVRPDEIETFYPAAAKAKGLEGQATVGCLEHDDAVWACRLTLEAPEGEGFGAAALALVKRYEASAPTADDRRFARFESLRIVFKPREVKAVRAAGTDYVLPERIEEPSADALYDAWPRVARFSGVEGSVNLWCTVTLEGRLTSCTVSKENGLGHGFGEAALKVTPLFRFAPARKNGVPAAMSIPIQVYFFCDVRCRRFEGGRRPSNAWVSVPTPTEVQAAYPPAAKARGREGVARLDCTATKAGELKDCRIAAESPAGEGFGAAALALADRFSLTHADPERISFSVAFDNRIGLVDWAWDANPFAGLIAVAPKGKTVAKVEGPPVVKGRSRLRCQAGQGGQLERCVVLDSEPADPEVARQVLENLSKVRVRSWTDEGRSTIGSWVELMLSTGPLADPRLFPAVAVPPTVASGVLDYRPQTVLASPPDPWRFFPARAQRMEVSGQVVLTCAGLIDGRPDGCQVTTEAPLDYGFGDAAQRMSKDFRYSPQSIDGVPTDEPILIPFNFAVPR
ncbi:TonB family protein [Caulobacter sp. LARHSG274]